MSYLSSVLSSPTSTLSSSTCYTPTPIYTSCSSKVTSPKAIASPSFHNKFNDKIDELQRQAEKYRNSKQLADVIALQTLVTELLNMYVPNDTSIPSTLSHSSQEEDEESECIPCLPAFTFAPKNSSPIHTIASNLLQFSFSDDTDKLLHKHIN